MIFMSGDVDKEPWSIRVTTENGSTYKLTRQTMEMRRVAFGARSTKLQSEQGKLVKWPDVAVGKRLVLQCKPVDGEADVRVIVTSLVRKIS